MTSTMTAHTGSIRFCAVLAPFDQRKRPEHLCYGLDLQRLFGGRCRVRTCDPCRVKASSTRWDASLHAGLEEGMTSLYDNDFAAWMATHHERIGEVLADRYSSVKVTTGKGEYYVATFTRRGGWSNLDVPPWMDSWRILWDLKTFIRAHRRLTA